MKKINLQFHVYSTTRYTDCNVYLDTKKQCCIVVPCFFVDDFKKEYILELSNKSIVPLDKIK